jgi:hypothetical protein
MLVSARASSVFYNGRRGRNEILFRHSPNLRMLSARAPLGFALAARIAKPHCNMLVRHGWVAFNSGHNGEKAVEFYEIAALPLWHWLTSQVETTNEQSDHQTAER